MVVGLVRIVGRVVLFDDVIEESHVLYIVVDEDRGQVGVVAADVVADGRLRAGLLPFGVVAVGRQQDQVAGEEVKGEAVILILDS